VLDAHNLLNRHVKQKVAAWVKQLGRYPKLNGTPLRIVDDDGERDRKGENVHNWPDSLKGLSIRRHPKLPGGRDQKVDHGRPMQVDGKVQGSLERPLQLFESAHTN